LHQSCQSRISITAANWALVSIAYLFVGAADLTSKDYDGAFPLIQRVF